jgi:hypothetical protein
MFYEIKQMAINSYPQKKALGEINPRNKQTATY